MALSILTLACDGDLDVDQHHTVEDVGIALGEAFDKALGDKRGILRAGYFVMPMDETLAIAAVDLSGRAAFAVDTKVRTRLVGDLQTELVTDFFEGFARGARANVHVKTMYGRSNHHKIEAIFKAFARALRVACSRDKQLGEMLPSTKGLVVGRFGFLLSHVPKGEGRGAPRICGLGEKETCADARDGDRLQGRQS